MLQLNPCRTTWHITFGTYGARLHGGSRPTVDKLHNRLGTPFLSTDAERLGTVRGRMNFSACRLTEEQRLFIEGEINSICKQGGWDYRICAAEVDHVHLLCDIVPEIHGEKVRRLVKRWLGQSLGRKWPLAKEERWWAVGGSNKAVKDSSYLNNVYRYILNQRSSPIEAYES